MNAKLVDHISNEMESGKTPVTLFIDLSKAFDTLSFDILLQNLNCYSIAGVNLKLPPVSTTAQPTVVTTAQPPVSTTAHPTFKQILKIFGLLN